MDECVKEIKELVVPDGRGRPRGYRKCKLCRVWVKPGVVHVCEPVIKPVEPFEPAAEVVVPGKVDELVV